jgi:hypothetical protein
MPWTQRFRLFALWTGRMLRPTRDADLLAKGAPGAGDLTSVFRELCEDGPGRRAGEPTPALDQDLG